MAPGKKPAEKGTPSNTRSASADGPLHKKLKGAKESEKANEAADITKQPELVPRKGEGYTPHNLQAWEQHTAYTECHLAAGNVNPDARDSFLEGLRADIEADGGETARQQQATERHAANLATATAN